MPFYKKDSDELLTAVHSVSGPGFEVYADRKDEYTYPIQGWYWFDSLNDAVRFFAAQMSGAPEVPQSLTMRQTRLVLLQAGLLDQVEAALQGIEDPVQRQAALIEWEYASTVERDSALIAQLGLALNLSQDRINALFEAGAVL